MDISVLSTLKPLDYLSRYVSISSSRRQLYNKVYVKHRSLKDGLLNETTILTAMEDVLGEPLSEEFRDEIWKHLGIVLKAHILTNFNYKQFCGVAAMVERLMCKKFATAKSDSTNAESKSEIEVADFDRLLTKIENLRMNESLRTLLIEIKNSGIVPQDTSDRGSHIMTRRRAKFEFIWPKTKVSNSNAIWTKFKTSPDLNNNTPFDEIGYKSEKYNYLDTLTLVHCFRKLKFKDPDMCHIIVDHAEAEPEEEIAPRGLLSLFPGRKLSLVTCKK